MQGIINPADKPENYTCGPRLRRFLPLILSTSEVKQEPGEANEIRKNIIRFDWKRERLGKVGPAIVRNCHNFAQLLYCCEKEMFNLPVNGNKIREDRIRD